MIALRNAMEEETVRPGCFAWAWAWAAPSFFFVCLLGLVLPCANFVLRVCLGLGCLVFLLLGVWPITAAPRRGPCTRRPRGRPNINSFIHSFIQILPSALALDCAADHRQGCRGALLPDRRALRAVPRDRGRRRGRRRRGEGGLLACRRSGCTGRSSARPCVHSAARREVPVAGRRSGCMAKLSDVPAACGRRGGPRGGERALTGVGRVGWAAAALCRPPLSLRSTHMAAPGVPAGLPPGLCLPGEPLLQQQGAGEDVPPFGGGRHDAAQD